MAETTDNPGTAWVAMAPVERAARAILPLLTDELNQPFAADDYGSVPMADEIVRAVLTAIREPSEEMEEVAGNYMDTAIPIEVAGIWQAMIDTMLAEEG